MCVEWEDAWANARWSPDDDDPENYTPYIVRTIGFVLWHNEKGIQTCGSVVDNGPPGSVHFVPRGMIRKIEVLEND